MQESEKIKGESEIFYEKCLNSYMDFLYFFRNKRKISVSMQNADSCRTTGGEFGRKLMFFDRESRFFGKKNKYDVY